MDCPNCNKVWNGRSCPSCLYSIVPTQQQFFLRWLEHISELKRLEWTLPVQDWKTLEQAMDTLKSLALQASQQVKGSNGAKMIEAFEELSQAKVGRKYDR